ncbi:DNA mismatch repair protein MutT [Clostridium folliculivorans]|uniref:DNA mismatch repair protein MutT n=1 Tax=Clostridium folliculivorans TaxID=2886038 RepID=A0A9W6D9X0_9CLOT|nr:NUDIX hydrolase [Clostridium folliculivorans]GKU24078.1 DNA mismatch repair protein MutT [Clostridium folliculivorans]
MFTIGAFALILDENNRFLLCHRTDKDLWNLPGGRVEKGETPWKAVIREVREEVGLDVEVIKLQGVYCKTFEDDIILSFLCKKVGGNLSLSDEADDINYFSINEIPINTVQRHIERIKDFYNDNESIILKGYYS